MKTIFTKRLLQALFKKLLPAKPKLAWVTQRVNNGKIPGKRCLL